MDIRGEYRFSSLVKQNKKAKICFVIHIAGEKKLLFYFYFVIVKQKIKNGAPGPITTLITVLKETYSSVKRDLLLLMRIGKIGPGCRASGPDRQCLC